MGKGGAKGRKKLSLTNQAKFVRQVTAKQQRKRANDRAAKQAREQKLMKAKAKAARLPYHRSQKLLLVGEGDFSFTRGLLLAWGNAEAAAEAKKAATKPTLNSDSEHQAQDASPTEIEIEEPSCDDSNQPRIVATCLDQKMELFEKYPHAIDTLEGLVQNEDVQVVTGVDCRELERVEEVNQYKYDRVIFQFPHTGCGEKDTARNNTIHRELLLDFLASAATVLRNAESEIHITIKRGEPYDSWGVTSLANEVPGIRVKSVRDFFPHLYPGYTHRRTVGAAFVATELGGPAPNQDISVGARTVSFCLDRTEANMEDDGQESD